MSDCNLYGNSARASEPPDNGVILLHPYNYLLEVMFVSLLIVLTAFNLNPDQRVESKMLQQQIADELGRVGRYESDLSVVMWNFVEVAHIVIDGDKLVVYFLGGWDPSILSQIFEFVGSGRDS